MDPDNLAVDLLGVHNAQPPRARVIGAVWMTLDDLRVAHDRERCRTALVHAIVLVCEDRDGCDVITAPVQNRLAELSLDELAGVLAVCAQASSRTVIGAIEILAANLRGSLSVMFAREGGLSTSSSGELKTNTLQLQRQAEVMQGAGDEEGGGCDGCSLGWGGCWCSAAVPPTTASEASRRHWAAAVVCVFALLLVPAGAYGATHLFDKLTFANFEAKPGTLIGDSKPFVSAARGQFVTSPVYLTIQSNPRGESIAVGVRALEVAIFTRYEALPALESQFGPMGSFQWPLGGVQGYFLPGFGNETFIGGRNNDTTIIVLNWLTQNSKPYTEKVESFLHRSTLAAGNRYRLAVSGMPQLLTAMKDTVLLNMGKIDAICIPLSFVFFAIAVRTSPLAVLVPLICLPASLALALGAAAPVAHAMSITAFAPEIMLSVVIALTMDFSLFLLTRITEQQREHAHALARKTPGNVLFQDEVANLGGGESDEKAVGGVGAGAHVRGELVAFAMRRVSHNIMISGFAIAGAFGALGFIDEEFIRGCALLGCIGALATTFTSLTLLPSVTLLLFPCIFSSPLCCHRKSAEAEEPKTSAVDSPGSSREQTLLAPAAPTHGPSDSIAPPPVAQAVQVQLQPVSEASRLLGPSPRPCSSDPTPASAGQGEGALLEVSRLSSCSPFTRALVPELNVWGRAAAFSSRHPIIVLAIVAALMGGLSYVVATGYRVDCSAYATCPHDISYWDDYNAAMVDFETVAMTPYYLMAVALDRTSSPYGINFMQDGAAYWPALGELVTAAAADPALGVSIEVGISAPNVWRGHLISFDDAQELLATSRNSSEGAAYAEMLDNHWRRNSGQGIVSVALRPGGVSTRSWGGAGTLYLKNLQRFAENASQQIKRPKTLFIGFWGPNADAWAVMLRVMSQFPMQLIITFAVLTGAVLVLFRSFLLALRMVVAMAMTMVFAFATVIITMRFGILSNAWPPLANISGLYWAIPVLASSVVCVASLDFDTFLMTRFIELRRQCAVEGSAEARRLLRAHRIAGNLGGGAAFAATTSAISGQPTLDTLCVISAVARTGPVVSWAALIMMMAFGVLIACNTIMLAQYGMMIAAAVFFDAFLVRPMVVPAIVALVPSHMLWFPRKFPDWAPTASRESSNAQGARD